MAKRKIPEVLTEAEQERLVSIFNERYICSQRNKTMIKLMLDIGLRLSETINLKWSQIDLQTGEVKVIQGKGNKDRVVWAGERLLEMLRRWRRRQKEEIGLVEYVFTTTKGDQLQPANVRNMVYNYAEKAGIEGKSVSPHTLRHTFATDFYRQTKNLRMVQKALGHADISTTQIYTHIVDDEMENAMKRFRR